MKPVRASVFDEAVPVDGRGKRTPQTLLAIDERDHFLREAARGHCVGMSDRQAAEWLGKRLARYRGNAWRRDASEALCPPRLAGRVEAMLWCVLKCHDRVVGKEHIRKCLRGRHRVYSLPTPDAVLDHLRINSIMEANNGGL